MPNVNSEISVAVIGAGPAGLMAADVLSASGYNVTIYEQKPNAGRKFILAGRSGLNLTNNAPLPALMAQYGGQASWLAGPCEGFTSQNLIRFFEDLGQPCFSGAGGKVFPTAMKATPLLRAWLTRLQNKGVRFHYKTRWCGFAPDKSLEFEGEAGCFMIRPHAVIFALGGCSWPRTGSDGQWAQHFSDEDRAPFLPSNCGFKAALPEAFYAKHAGSVLHEVTLRYGARVARGDLMITAEGFEGAPLYAISPLLRDEISRLGAVHVSVTLQPLLSARRFDQRSQQLRPRESRSNQLRRLGFTAQERGLVIACLGQYKQEEGLIAALKNLTVSLAAPTHIDRAISSAGGLRREMFDDKLMMIARPGFFAAGEMLDWEAPTGGYLLQACFSTGYFAAKSAMTWLTQRVD